MKLYANPGRRVEMVAEIVLEQAGHDHVVVDCESGKQVTLAELVRAFREDAESGDVGWVKVTIEPYERGPQRRRLA